MLNREYPTRPIVAVGVFVVCEGEVLLIKRAKEPGKGRYSIPGGAQRLGETNAEAARREVLEETGLTLSSMRLFEIFDVIQRDSSGAIQFQYVIVDYIAEVVPEERALARASSDAEEARWVGRDEARGLPLTDGLWPLLERLYPA